MKKLLSFIFMLMLALTLVGCEEEETTKYKVLLPSGTPLMAIGNLLDDETFDFTVVNGQDSLMEGFTQGEYDMIIAPLNLGTKLYINQKSVYKMKAVITTNNTYIISKNPINSIEEINGKKLLAFGNGSTPSLALNAIIDYKKLENVEVEYRSSASDVALEYTSANTEFDYFLSAEPNITTLKNKTQKEIYTLSLADVLKDEVSVLIQACLFINPNSDVSEKAIKKIENNIKSMNENPAEYAESVKEKNNFFTNLGKEIIEKAIPNCNITYLSSKEHKEEISEYYALLNKYQPAVLEGATPDEDFFI